MLNERGSLYSPGGLRKDCLEKHLRFIEYLEAEGYKLRYSGGFVPDINQILIKRGGIFTYPALKKSRGASSGSCSNCSDGLHHRAGGGGCHGRAEAILSLRVEDLEQRCPIYIGSRFEVEKAMEFLS